MLLEREKRDLKDEKRMICDWSLEVTSLLFNPPNSIVCHRSRADIACGYD